VETLKISTTDNGAELHIIGHDWGSWMIQAAAKMRPELFKSVTLVSVPETKVLKEKMGGNIH